MLYQTDQKLNRVNVYSKRGGGAFKNIDSMYLDIGTNTWNMCHKDTRIVVQNFARCSKDIPKDARRVKIIGDSFFRGKVSTRSCNIMEVYKGNKCIKKDGFMYEV